MDFLQHLETDLTVLAAEAGTKFPEVTEAAQRGVIKVRKMREQYAAAIRMSGGEPPPLSMFRSQDLLRPFLLACNHSDAPTKLISMALGSLQHLIQRDALYPGDCPNVMRVLAIQASTALKNRDGNAQVKVVQTLVMVVNWTSCDMAEETLGQALSICLNLHRSKTSHVRGAVHMTIRQLVRLMFDRLTDDAHQRPDDESLEGSIAKNINSNIRLNSEEAGAPIDNTSDIRQLTNQLPQHESPILRSARQLFLDLCAISGGDGGVWLKKGLLRREVGLELLDDIFIQKPELFLPGHIFSRLLADVAVPMLKNLVNVNGISLHLEARALILLGTIVKNFGSLVSLRENLGDILSAKPWYLNVPPSSSPSPLGDGERTLLWLIVLRMEPIECLVESPKIFENLFEIFDLGMSEENEGSKQQHYSASSLRRPVVETLLESLTHCVTLTLPYFIDGSSSSADVGLISDWRAGEPLSKVLFHSFQSSSTDKEIAPQLANGEPVLATLHCAASVAHTVASICIESTEGVIFSWLEWMNRSPLLQITALTPKRCEGEDDDVEAPSNHHRKLCDMAWPHLLDCTSATANHFVQLPGMRNLITQCIGCIALACGSQGNEKGFETAFSHLYQFTFFNQSHPPAGGGGVGAAAVSSSYSSYFHSKQWETMAVFFTLVHMLSNVMNYVLWVKTFEALEYLNTACSVVVSMPDAPSPAGNRNVDDKEVFDIRLSVQQAKEALSRFPKFTSFLSSSSLVSAFSALCSECTNALASDATYAGPFPTSAPLTAPNVTSSSLVSRVGAAVRGSFSLHRLSSVEVGMSSSPPQAAQRVTPKPSHEIGPESFIMKLTINCFSENAWRIGDVWDTVVAYLRLMINSSRGPLREYALVSLQELISNALSQQVEAKAAMKDELNVFEEKIPPISIPLPQQKQLRKAPSSSESQQPLEDRFANVFDVAPLASPRGNAAKSTKNNVADPPLGFNQPLEVRLFSMFPHFAIAPHMKTREAILKIQDNILQSTGQELTDAWSVVIETLKGVVLASDFSELALGDEEEEGEAQFHHHPSLIPWGGNCLLLAFSSLKLIIDDFLGWLPRRDVTKIISAIGAFGRQTEGVNLSLTAVGMLLTVCDYFSEMGSSWTAMFNELQSLASDRRPEVRNCAIHTLFSALTGSNCLKFGKDQWRSYFVNVAFPIIDQVMISQHAASSSTDTAVAPELKKGVRMLMHHSRDTDRKQWDESAVLALRGLGRVMQSFGRILAPLYSWFATEVWPKSLGCYVRYTELEGLSPEVARAVLDGLTTLAQVVSLGGVASLSDDIEPDMSVVGGILQRQVPSKKESVEGVTVNSADLSHSAICGEDKVEAEPVRNPELGDAFSSSSFSIKRTELWQAAWKAFHQVAACMAKVDTDLSRVLVECLVSMYNSSRAKADWEFGGNPEGERNAEELLQVLDELMIPSTTPIVSMQNDSGTNHSQIEQQPVTASKRELQGEGGGGLAVLNTGSSKLGYSQITQTQRSILEFMRSGIDSAWERVLKLLSRYSFSALQEGKLSQLCASESAHILTELMSNGRVPSECICRVLPSLLKEMQNPSTQSTTIMQSISTFAQGNRSSSSIAARYLLLETPPTTTAHTAKAHHLALILEGTLPHVNVGPSQEREAWRLITNCVEDIGLSWARGWLKCPTSSTPSGDGQQQQQQASSLDENDISISDSIRRSLLLVVERVECGPLYQLSTSNNSVKHHVVSDTAVHVVQSVLAIAGNILCSVFGMPPLGEPESEIPAVFTSLDIIKDTAGVLLRAAKGEGYWGSNAYVACRRMALWELIRALYWSLHWHSVVETSLRPMMIQQNDDGNPTTTAATAEFAGNESADDASPSLKSEHELVERSIDSSCLVVLNGMIEVMKDCIFPSDFLTAPLVESVETMFACPSERPPPEEMVAICTVSPPCSVTNSVSKLETLRFKRGSKVQEILLPLYPLLMERLESRSKKLCIATSRLLLAMDIPRLLKQLKDENADLLKEIRYLCKD